MPMGVYESNFMRLVGHHLAPLESLLNSKTDILSHFMRPREKSKVFVGGAFVSISGTKSRTLDSMRLINLFSSDEKKGNSELFVLLN